jgi:shikimate dehydrogenase
MLLHQARPGFETWFGIAPQVDQALRDVVAVDIPKRDGA